MAIQLSVAVRTLMAAALETETGPSARMVLFTGTLGANCAAPDPSGELLRITCPSDWATQATGQLLLAGSWSGTASAGTAATPVCYRIFKADGVTCTAQGSAGIGAGDVQVNGTITSGQTVTITAYTLTMPGA